MSRKRKVQPLCLGWQGNTPGGRTNLFIVSEGMRGLQIRVVHLPEVRLSRKFAFLALDLGRDIQLLTAVQDVEEEHP